MPTIKQIAQLAGVSRGTVDRVLNNRGRVNPETEARIRQIAEAVNYSPNRLGKTLSIRKKGLCFGYVLFGRSAGNPFFEDVEAGIRRKAAELEEYGVQVLVRSTPMGDAAAQLRCIDELIAAGIDGLALTPIAHPLVEARVRALAANGLPVVTVNSDLPGSGRLAYVGADGRQSGQTAAGLMARFTSSAAQVGVVLGSRLVAGHAQRLEGFTARLAECYPGLRVVATAENNDDDLLSYEVTAAMLAAHPELTALFLTAGGVQGACRALERAGAAGKLTVISFDTVPHTRQMLRAGVITATLGQQPEVQGAQPLDILLNALGMGLPPGRELFTTKTEIYIAENLP